MTLKTGDILQKRYRIVPLAGQVGLGAVSRAGGINVPRPVALGPPPPVGGGEQAPPHGEDAAARAPSRGLAGALSAL